MSCNCNNINGSGDLPLSATDIKLTFRVDDVYMKTCQLGDLRNVIAALDPAGAHGAWRIDATNQHGTDFDDGMTTITISASRG